MSRSPYLDGNGNEITPVSELRQRQANAVMPLIGPLLDAWDGTPNDEKDPDSPLYRAIQRIAAAMEGR